MQFIIPFDVNFEKYIIMRITLKEEEQRCKKASIEMECTEVDSSFDQINRKVIERAQSILRNIRQPPQRAKSSNYNQRSINYVSLGGNRTSNIVHSSRKSYNEQRDEIDFLSLESVAKRKKGKNSQIRRHSQGIIMRTEKGQGISNKITMHCLRSDRNKIIQQTQRLDTSLNFVKQKLEKNLRYKKIQLKNQIRLKTLHENTRKQKQQLQKVIISSIQIEFQQQVKQKGRIQEIRKDIFYHRNNRQKAIRQKEMTKAIQCHIQRQQRGNLRKKRNEKYAVDLTQRKIKYQQQKERSQSFHLRKKRALSNIKEEAKRIFHNRWLQQYSLTAQAKEDLLQKQETYYKKMSRVIEKLSKASSPLCQ